MKKNLKRQQDPRLSNAPRSRHPGVWWSTLTASLTGYGKQLRTTLEVMMDPKKTLGVVIAGIFILGMICLTLLSFNHIRLQVDGWQLEVVRLVEKTATAAGVPFLKDTPATQPSPTQAVRAEDTHPPRVFDINKYIVTDPTWRFSRTPATGWEQLAYNDPNWSQVGTADDCLNLPGVPANCVWDYPIRLGQTDTLYFRKVFNVETIPPQARLFAAASSSPADEVFLNGSFVYKTENIDPLGTRWSAADVTSLLVSGQNVLAVKATDNGGGGAFLETVLALCYSDQDRYGPTIRMYPTQQYWFDGKVYLEALDAPCDSGVAEVAYQVDEGDWQITQSYLIFNLPSGEHNVQARVTDQTGRQGFFPWHVRVGPQPALENSMVTYQRNEIFDFTGPILTPISNRQPEFQEDFENANSGWTTSNVVGGAHAGELGYAGGEYFLVASPASTPKEWRHAYETVPMQPVDDFALELDARFIDGNDPAWEWGFFYIHFRVDAGAEYTFAFDPKGMASLEKVEGPGAPGIRLANRSDVPVNQVGMNKIHLMAKGSQMAVVLNGQELFLVDDQTLQRGSLILGIANRGSLPLRMQVDNFKVWDISALR